MDQPAALDVLELLNPPPRLFERLRQIPGYTWDEHEPFHSSYDNWQVFGRKHTGHLQPPINGVLHTSATSSERSSPRPGLANLTELGRASSEGESELNEDGQDPYSVPVLARVSSHTLREERAYHICKNLTKSVDPEGEHIVRPVDIVRLAAQQGDKGPIVVCIYEYIGDNYLEKVVDYGPFWYKGRKVGEKHEAIREGFTPRELVPLRTFLDFAVGATECLEILHHGQRIVHGEIRGDAFHMDQETGSVKLINFGSGLRTFEHGLTSTGWSTLSKEVGAKNKISYMSPEQTGRMSAEPDSRTDIYSLGILFWTMLTQQPAFEGETPMDIVQSVLGRRLPSVSSIRFDIPDVIARIIQKMTMKAINDRYHSASGLRHDLVEVRRLLGAGDAAALRHWKIATKDISSFFILPNIMIGRSDEHDEVVKIIDKVSKRHIQGQKQDVYSLSSGSSLSEARLEGFESAYGLGTSSEGDTTSSFEERPNALKGVAAGIKSGEPKSGGGSSGALFRSGSVSQHNSTESRSSTRSNPLALKPWEKNTSLSLENKSIAETINSDKVSSSASKHSSEGAGSLGTTRNVQKFRRRGRCEVISISGAAGLGKSCLVQSVQIEARRRGYFASSKFDQAKKTPFGPVLRLLSSLFKQVFSESNTETLFHQTLKQYVRPAWPMLHKVLGLPEFLLGPPIVTGSGQSPVKGHASQLSQGYNKSLRAELGPRREVSPSNASLYSLSLGTQSSQDFLRAGSSTKSVRLMNTFMDVLRVFTQHKFICFVIDDLQFADDESLDLITQIVSARTRMVLIITYRPDEILPEKIAGIVNPPNTEEYIKASGVGITRIALNPLSEEDILQYVAATLCLDKSEVLPLAAVIQSKTAGNPFYMREMLDTCHRKQCIWYDYKESGWKYDLDRVFTQFRTSNYHDTLNSEFVTSRLNELPATSRSILAWASLVGTTFSFTLIQRLLSGEFDYDDETVSGSDAGSVDQQSFSEQEIVEGLQACIQAYIVVATQDDEKFRFAHDRYLQAAASLRECTGPKMHFIIAQTLLKYYFAEERSRDAIASHVCESIDVIKERIQHRQSFRALLFDCAQTAAESGARPTAAKFYANCFALLQNNPWNEDELDVYYDETLTLYVRAAECYLYMGNYVQTKKLLAIIFEKAKTPVDKAPAWVLQSRVYAQESDPIAAFQSLKNCLAALDIHVDDAPTFEKCDAEFERLVFKIQSFDLEELTSKSAIKGSNIAAVGAVLVETITAAFWTDRLTFYQMALVMVDTQITCGNFPQSGMAYLHLAMIAVTRFNMVKFACEMGNISLTLMDRWRDPYTMGRGGTMYSLFVGHFQHKLSDSLTQLEGALEYAIQAGDRTSTILNFGLVAFLKFFASENLAELDSFCTFGCEEISDWNLDTRGGTMVIALRQVSRALQGKTATNSPADVLSDESHNSPLYKEWLQDAIQNVDRSLVFYEGIEICPLFLFGHYEAAVEMGDRVLHKIDTVWSARNTRFTMLFQGLSLAGVLWWKLQNPLLNMKRHNSQTTILPDQPNESELDDEILQVINSVKHYQRKIEDWQVVNDVNYLAWSKILAAQIAELSGNHGAALKLYEESLDHAASNGFAFEEALGNYLMAGCFLRIGSRRPAVAALKEAIALYRAFGAIGVAKHIETEHALILQGPTRNTRTADISVQTDFAGDSAPVQYETLEGDENGDSQQNRDAVTETKGDRIGAWQGGSARNAAGSGLPALDMLDLTSILESSQVISSVLQIDQLLKTMCEIILQNCGGLATMAAIVVEEDDPIGWSIAASGNPEKGAEAHMPGIPLSETALVAEGVILYTTRFRETVFLPDLVHDERFSNVSEAWATLNPTGKSVIAIPIAHGDKPLLGVLYLEGEPNAFTDRNLTVLQLLVNQIGISYSNALTLKEVEKVSAFNNSMVDVQKRALEKALDAERRANAAKAEALRNVKLAEEAMKTKSIFLANVSHELRTPLNGVIGNSELLLGSDLRQDQYYLADSIRISADLLLTVINDILDFSKMEADKMKLFVVAFNPDEMIREVVRSVSYSNRDKKSSKNVEILQEIKLPQSLICGDPVRLHQVLGNLIGNSLKFTENGSITVGAQMDWETDEAVQLNFWVKDTGIGIPPQQLSKLFTPFSQADASTARKYGGSGLGLSICKSIVEQMMGGKIVLESVEGEGTTARFTVKFPKAKAEANPGDSLNSAEEPAPVVESEREFPDFSKIPRDQLRICVAEDNPINQKIAIQFMEKLGYKHVDAYDNGLVAVEGLRRMANEGKPYQIVLMDVQMPVLDGYEATKLIRRDPIEAVRGVLVIAMTASAISGDREKCLESGMNDYLAKPVRSAVLKKKLDQYLQQTPIPTPDLHQEGVQIANEVMKTANGTNTPSPLKQMQNSGDQTPIPRRPSLPQRVFTSRKVSVTENISPKNTLDGVDGIKDAQSSPDDRDGQTPKALLTTNVPLRAKEEEVLSPNTPTANLIKRKASKLQKKGKEPANDLRRSPTRDPNFGEHANDGLGISKEEDMLPPSAMIDDHIKRKSSKLHRKGKEAAGEVRRSSSVSRDPKFGECANDAIGIRKDAKDARDLSNSNIAAASLAAFEETMTNRKK